MKKVPKMISTKDLSYISDMFNWHLIAAKKLELYTSLIEDDECLKKIEKLGSMHCNACKTLCKLLESGDNNG